MKTLIITGASKGIGLATATRFCDAGYRIINFSRTIPPDDRIESYSIDLSDENTESNVATLLNTLIKPGEISLVHNAGRMVNDSARDADTKILAGMLRLNVIAPHILNRCLITKMRPGSSIIYVGSTLSEKAVANTFSYITSKHALVGMMRATCQDLMGTGIHTTCICPGFTDTEMLRAHVGDNQEILNDIAGLSAFGRLIEPGEIADAIFFAANNPVINGAVMHANLGQIES
ncbi:MAG: SDR family NAD(P)-dependent oxidoreductase [Gammaproteobacteria bacterium]|nr:SDR family NAD(P)-dependent oxidoreductase [Gammaproteobacteria bacterium]